MPQQPESLACVVLAHQDPVQLRRLVDALDPFPVFLHIDARVSDELFHELTVGLPDRVRILDRVPTPWARWGIMHAEIDGYRRALAETNATHVALLTGADYPLTTTDEIGEFFLANEGRSFTTYSKFPFEGWRMGGYIRLRFPWTSWRKHAVPLPFPRRYPKDVVFAGGSAHKVLARRHAEAVVRAHDTRPDIVRFWRRSWVPDETFVASIVNSPMFVPNWADEHTDAWLWWIGWDDTNAKSPPWITEQFQDVLLARRMDPRQEIPFFFARKFSTALSTGVMDRIDAKIGRTRRGGSGAHRAESTPVTAGVGTVSVAGGAAN